MKILNKIKLERKGRLFFVGDIHGEYISLKRKLKEVCFNYSEDTLIFVGDLIDRGDNIKETLDFFLKNECFYGVIGNHDKLMFDLYKNKEWLTDERHGGEKTLSELGYEGVKKYKKELLHKMSLILQIEKDEKIFGVIHGGIPFDNNKPYEWHKIIRKAKNNKNYRMNLLWDRSVISAFKPGFLPQKRINGDKVPPEITGIDFIIHGHTRLKTIENYQNRYFIDTFNQSDDFIFLLYDAHNQKLIAH